VGVGGAGGGGAAPPGHKKNYFQARLPRQIIRHIGNRFKLLLVDQVDSFDEIIVSPGIKPGYIVFPSQK
jgi:hypothetical protein